MSVTIIGKSDGVVFFGPRSAPKAVRWWAERGQIHFEDSRTGQYGILSVKDFLERLKAINDLLSEGRKVENQGFAHPDEINRQMNFIEAGVELAKKAKEQGMPQDPQVRKHKAQELPVSVSVPKLITE
jgi:DNA-binding transcriptional MerR regulator